MFALPIPIQEVSLVFAPVFACQVWSHAQFLILGAILACGKRSGTSALRVMGLTLELHFTDYYPYCRFRTPTGLLPVLLPNPLFQSFCWGFAPLTSAYRAQPSFRAGGSGKCKNVKGVPSSVHLEAAGAASP